MTRPPSTAADGRLIIGWREYVTFPDWGVSMVRAKADTGARTSAVDVSDIEEMDDGRVRFGLVVSRPAEGTPEIRTIEANVIRRTRIKSSFGAAHDRLVVSTRMTLGPVTKDIELGLVCRRRMYCRMLLGRVALEPEFLVDAAHCYLFGRRPRRARKEKDR